MEGVRIGVESVGARCLANRCGFLRANQACWDFSGLHFRACVLDDRLAKRSARLRDVEPKQVGRFWSALQGPFRESAQSLGRTAG